MRGDPEQISRQVAEGTYRDGGQGNLWGATRTCLLCPTPLSRAADAPNVCAACQERSAERRSQGYRPVTLTGSQIRYLSEGSYPQSEPERWANVKLGKWRRIGAGSLLTVPMLREDVADLLDYVEGVLGCLVEMTPEERGEGGAAEVRMVRDLTSRLRTSLEMAP